MSEFWETAFKNNAKMWGENPTNNALEVLDLFEQHNISNILVPGFGYGRNAKVFYDKGFKVTGIEISETAIVRARKHFGNDTTIYHGSVNNMPYSNTLYQGIYCYALIHLLDAPQRKKLIKDCYQQLQPKGLMVFTAISTNDKRFGVGEEIEHNTYQSPHGLSLYFYNEAAIKTEFGNYNIIDLKEITEPTEKLWMVVCEKNC